MSKRQKSLFDPQIVRGAVKDSFRKLHPRVMVRNPVMFVVYIGSILTTGLFVQALAGRGEAPAGFILAVAVWLWFTVLFANFAEAMAEGRGKAQAAALRQTRRTTIAKKLQEPRFESPRTEIPSPDLRKGDVVLVEAGDTIPGDGEVIEGAASVNEAAVTGESAPVIRESGGDRSAVTGGTTVVSDWIKVRITSEAGNTFLDRMIAMVEGADRRKTPNEIALAVLLAGLTLIFLIAVVTLLGLGAYSG
ncbi:MAG TPA: potassium-transporting ATPase subunit B, partial [Thermoanaerobaculia bacterium]